MSPISCQDNVAFDPHGNPWISTDGAPGTLGAHDALFGVPVKGAERGQVRRFPSVPEGAETCGPIVQDQRVLDAVQHPGRTDGSTYESPSSHRPGGGRRIPRPSLVVVVWSKGGRVVPWVSAR